jgi:branched-chain amino acid transport system permease protein
MVGVLVATMLAAGLAWPIFRLRGPFFAIATLALTVVAAALANYFSFTGGPRGVSIPFNKQLFTDLTSYAWLMLGFLALAAAITVGLKRSRLGFYLLAVRDDEDAARAAGISPLQVKTFGLMLSAALTALGGGLFAEFVGFVDPSSAFSLDEVGIRLPLLALIGGVGTVPGPIIGALLMQPSAEYLRGTFGTQIPGLHLIILGILLILAALYFKHGVWGTVSHAARWVLVRGR